MESPISPTSTVLSQKHLPPDVTASEPIYTSNATGNDLISNGQNKWYSRRRRLYLPWAPIYIIHVSTIIVFGILALGFGLKTKHLMNRPDGRAPYRVTFWCTFGMCMGMILSVVIILFFQLVVLPAFWRKRAKAIVRDGIFSFLSPSNLNSYNKLGNSQHRYKNLLEIGCNDGHVSAMFAREIIRVQNDMTDLNQHVPNLPIFIGYDMWKWWSRIPNTPKAYLRTLLDANVPRDHIIANRVDLTSEETKLHLPYADDSISFIICNLGLPEVCKWYSAAEQRAIFRELARVLEPGGRMILLENANVEWDQHYAWIIGGPMAKYRRILVDELGWSKENAQTHWAWYFMQYLDATKPISGTKLMV